MEFVYQMFGFNLKSKMPASNDQHFNKPSRPTMTTRISRPKKQDVATADTGKSTAEKKSGSEEVKASDPDQSVETIKLEKRIGVLIRFSPAYAKDDTEPSKKAKDGAWEHIINGGNGTERSCIWAIREIEMKVEECYDDTNFDKKLKRGGEFRMMMVKDGCFFLQLALHILGGREHLGYSDQDTLFGKNGFDTSSFIPDMFLMGNQIPYIVIKALMEQPFFQDVIKKGVENNTWRRPTTQEDPVRLALYQTVVEPQLTPTKKQAHHHREPPSDILSELRNVLLGSRRDDAYPSYYEMMGFLDLEEAGGSKEEDKFKFPRAGKLSKLGIKLRKTNKGITGIRFKNLGGLSAYLSLPSLIVDAHTDHLLASLISHELRMNESERHVTAYIRLIRDLIPTYKDFKLLEANGIIRSVIEDEQLKFATVRKLHELVSLHDPNFTPGIREIRQKIREYETVPWRQISFACSIACGIITFVIAALTIVQTVFTVISYYHTRSN